MKSVIEIGRGNGSRKKMPGSSLPIATFSRAASVLTLAALLGLTACDNDYTLAYVYAPSETTTTSGLINAYGIDNQTGSLRLLADSPIPSGGRKPVAIVATPPDPTGKLPQAIYVINYDDSNVVEFTIGTDGKLYPQNTYNTTSTTGTITSGSYPTALAISPDGNFLYVAYTYQPGYTTASPGPGGITIFQINSNRSLGPVPVNPQDSSQPSYPNSTIQDFPIGRAPVAIAVSSKTLANGKNTVYVVSQDSGAVNPAASGASNQTLNLFAFSADPTTGSLSTLPGETIVSGNVPSLGYATGIAPGGVLTDASATHLYVTDTTGNAVIGYSIDPASGLPSPLLNGTVATGSQPLGMTIDPSGTYLFVANFGSGTIGEYTFDSNGDPVISTVAGSTQAGTGTNCVAVEPTHGVYVYASGLISNSITGEQLIPSGSAAGTLKPIINSPYPATTLPVCAITVPRFQ